MAYPLNKFSTARLEDLFAQLLREMRRRDSNHIAHDVVTNSQTLRFFRSTDKLP